MQDIPKKESVSIYPERLSNPNKENEVNILITGIAGFIGSHVTVYLVRKYPHYTFVGLDKLSYCSNTKNFKEIEDNPNFCFIAGDINDIQKLKFIFATYNINYVLHFAAYTHVDHSFANSILFTQNNVLGTHTLLEVSKQCHVKKFIHVSTDEVYGDRYSSTASGEETIIAPTNPYSATKAAAEHLVRSYFISFNLPIIITRGNNVYGPKQFPEKVIPKFINHLVNMEKCPIQGSGKQKRSFLYINDVIQAFDIIFHKGKIGMTYNIASIDEYDVEEIHDKLLNLVYPGESADAWKLYIKDRDFNDRRYYISSSKLEALGWKQEINFDIGLKETVDWYISNPNYWEKQH